MCHLKACVICDRSYPLNDVPFLTRRTDRTSGFMVQKWSCQEKTYQDYSLSYFSDLTLMMTSAQVVETSVSVTIYRPSHDLSHWDDQTRLT